MRDFLDEQLNTPMTRKQFLQMSGSLLLAVIGFQNLLQVLMKHTSTNTAPHSLLTPDSSNGFGSRKFGQ